MRKEERIARAREFTRQLKEGTVVIKGKLPSIHNKKVNKKDE
jgi:hypothetical protein